MLTQGTLVAAVTAVAVLLALALLSLLWMWTAGAVMGVLARGVVRVGLYDPDSAGSDGPTDRRKDRVVHLFLGAIRSVSRLVPGEPLENPLVITVPLLVVGVPTFLCLLGTMVVLPIVTGATVANAGPSSWSFAFGLTGFVGYYTAFLAAVTVWRHL